WRAAGALCPGPVKIMVEEGPRGLRPAPSLLARRIVAAARSGAQVAVHSLGAATLVATLAAFAAVPPRYRVGRRHRLEHVAECPPPLVPTIAALDLMVVTNPAFVRGPTLGGLVEGGPADLIVVEPDPLRAPPDEVADARVGLTLVAGKAAWRA